MVALVCWESKFPVATSIAVTHTGFAASCGLVLRNMKFSTKRKVPSGWTGAFRCRLTVRVWHIVDRNKRSPAGREVRPFNNQFPARLITLLADCDSKSRRWGCVPTS